MRSDVVSKLSRMLLELYGAGHAIEAPRFRSWALERLARDIPHSGAAWVYGVMTAQGAVFHDLVVRGLSAGFAEAVQATAAADPLSHKLAAASGRSFIHSRADYPAEVLRIAGDADDLQSSLEGMVADAPTGLFASVCLFRSSAFPPFTDAERRLHEGLLPHWVEAFSRKLIDDAFARSRTPAESSRAAAVARSDGVLEAATARLAGLLQLEWPHWPGGRLPQPLLGRALSLSEWVHDGERVLARVRRLQDRLLVEVREHRPMDALGRRERQVAEHLCDGLGIKEVAARLDLSPSTVEKHRDNIYRKLAVSNRTALIKAMRETL